MSLRQSKLASFVEACFNTFIGLVVSFVAQAVISWAYDMKLTYYQVGVITFWMTILSVLRSYVIRRIWNSEFWKGVRR